MACFFRTDEADLHLAFLQGKHLRPEHGSIRDTDQLELVVFDVIAGDDENHGPSGEEMT